MPKKLELLLKSLTPNEADEFWMYFDGCSNEGIIEIVQVIALTDPKIAEREQVLNDNSQKTT